MGLIDATGTQIARGQVKYPSGELRQLAGYPADEIRRVARSL